MSYSQGGGGGGYGQQPAMQAQAAQAARLQQQQMLMRAQQLSQQQQQQQQSQQPSQPNLPEGMVLVGDGNDSLRAAKKRKPTDRSLPSFPTSASPTLHSLSTSYAKLQSLERKLDWTLARKKIELPEQIGSVRTGGVTRTLRVYLTSTLVHQPHQLGEGEKVEVGPEPVLPTPPEPVVEDIAVTTAAPTEGEPTAITVEGGADATVVPPPAPTTPSAPAPAPTETPAVEIPSEADLLASSKVKFGAAGEGVPGFELVITAELINGAEEEKGVASPIGKYIKRITITTDRNPSEYDECGPLDWKRPPSTIPPTPSPHALTFSLPTTQATNLRLALHLEHQPEVFGCMPEFGGVVETTSGDRSTLLQALWRYVRSRGLVDEEKRMVRTDERLKKLFAGHTTVAFHHLPEFVNRFLVPLPPVYIDHLVRTDSAITSPSTTAFDLEINVEDPSRPAIEKTAASINTPNEGLVKELTGLDEKIALDALSLRTTLLRSTSLHSFATSPIPFLQTYIASQSSDLELILAGERGNRGSVGAGANWREEVRRKEGWEGKWVGEAVGVWSGRVAEGARVQQVVAVQGQGGQGQQRR